MQDLIQSCSPVNITKYRRGHSNARNYPSSCKLASLHTLGRDVTLLDLAGCPPNIAIAETKHVLHYEGTTAMADAAMRTGLLCTMVNIRGWMPFRRCDPDSLGKTSFMSKTMAAIDMAVSKLTNSNGWRKTLRGR